MRQFQLKNLRQIELKNKNVFMRVDFNVPLKDKKIIDSYRIEKAFPSIEYVLEQGGRLVLASHLGRPKGKVDKELSLKPVAKYLSEAKNLEVFFIEDPKSLLPKKLLKGLKKTQVILLENLRFHKGEESLDKNFAKRIASYTDIYVNEGFGISHRKNSSVTLIPELVSQRALGFQFEKELEKLDIILDNKIKKPFCVILGGSKLEDKIPLMEALLDKMDELLVGGLMSYTFLKAQGKQVGQTFVEEKRLSKVREFIERLEVRNRKIFLPVDFIVEDEGKIKTVTQSHFPESAIGKDIGPKTREIFDKRIQQAHSIFWNGPLGLFEKEEFSMGTHHITKALIQNKQAYRVVGGGHSALALRGFEQEVDHVSTGGGASLFYLKGQGLPGLKSLLSELSPLENQLRQEI
ncbi:MAG: phosphoglycerate kinase [Bdellovibrionaceae bacterium]|nr:phosphoglycerate kinase [Pseudobdellovibrionaceae bacterium]